MLRKAYLSLGSNQGDRLEFLQSTLLGLEELPLTIIAQSHLYETPAWGFEGTTFYNACIAVETILTPSELLNGMLQLEQKLGRYRSAAVGYQSRTIDLDLLAYENRIIQQPALKIPHPLLHQREFVLRPLNEIASQWKHPTLNQTVEQLLAPFEEGTILQKPFKDWSPFIFSSFPFLVIEGNIGAGKTTLAQQITSHFDALIMLEKFADNPHLASFYKNPKAHAKALETHFLKERSNAIHRFWKKNQATKVIADFSFFKSAIFAQNNLSSADFTLFCSDYDAALEKQPLPSLVLYLEAPISFHLQRIKQRARPFEQEITIDYLEKIEEGYATFFRNNPDIPVLKISIENRDFKNNPYDFQWLLRRISAFATLS